MRLLKIEHGDISFLFHKLTVQHKTKCLQRFKKIFMWEVLPALALNMIYLKIFITDYLHHEFSLHLKRSIHKFLLFARLGLSRNYQSIIVKQR